MKKLCVWMLATAALAVLLPPGMVTARQATPEGPRVETFQDVNVRAGPGTDYDLVGILIRGQGGAILGRSPDSFWIKIVYIGGPDNSGWVFRDLVRVVGDVPSLPTVIPPPTPTRPPTVTPGFIAEGTPTPEPASQRLPTYTPAAAIIRPTLLPPEGVAGRGGFPPAALMIALFVLGGIGGLVSLLRQQR